MTGQGSLFDLPEGERRKEEGISRATSAHGEWLESARWVAVQIASRLGAVTADDIRAAGIDTPEGASPNVWGGVFNDPRFEFVGITRSARPVAHARVLRVWRLAEKRKPAVDAADSQ